MSAADEARRDAELYGVGFVVNGSRVEPAKVVVFRAEGGEACAKPDAWLIKYPDGVTIPLIGETCPKAYLPFAKPLFFGPPGGACADPVVETNVALLRSRSTLGIEKYGVTLADSKAPLRDWLEHALLELLDCANYMQTAMRKIDAEQGAGGDL